MNAIDTNHHEKEKIQALANLEGDLVIEFFKKDWKFVNTVIYQYNTIGKALKIVEVKDNTLLVGNA